MSQYQIECADVRTWSQTYTGPQFHALFCDAPYELREVDDPDQIQATSGFMGKEWDGSGITFQPDTWLALSHHLLPGAYLFVFAGTLNDDLISLAMRRAGLRKHHKMLGWVYGKGMPKPARLDDQIDKAAGHTQPVVGVVDRRGLFDGKTRSSKAINTNWREAEGRTDVRDVSQKVITEPVTPLAKAWAGHRYGKQSLKPAIEPVLVFQKPYQGKPLDSITRTGAGALDITTTQTNHRWPANFYLDQSLSDHMNAQAGMDAAAYFFNVETAIEEADPIFYCAKPGKVERNAGTEGNPHPTVKPLSLTRWLASMLLPPVLYAPRRLLVPFAGSGSEMIGGMLAGWDEVLGIDFDPGWSAIAEQRAAYWQSH